ncbi:MAG: hypothetical protein WA919_29680 [Coleofasciculaceae cyanobacterium]
MSEDQQKQPTAAEESGEELVSNELAQSPQNRELPFLKAQTIKLLQANIRLLEGVVERLEKEPEKVLPSIPKPGATTSVLEPGVDSITTEPELVSSTPEPATAAPISETPTITPELEVGEIETEVEVKTDAVFEPTPSPEIKRSLPGFSFILAFWSGTLQKIRLFLPSAWNELLSDWVLSGAIASIVVATLLTTVVLLPKTPNQIAKAPIETIETPPELEAPQEPQIVEAAPPPPPQLTPEESLVVAIQKQVAEITDEYGEGLIKAIQANFLESRLIVKVSDNWYELETARQDKLADKVLARANELDFSKLEIFDQEENLIARSPVVGIHMVIFDRNKSSTLSETS